MTLGSAVLLAANLMSERPAAPDEAPETPVETAAAERLVALAVEQAKALEEAGRPGSGV